MSSFAAEINKLKNIQHHLEKYETCLVENLSKCKEHKEFCDFYTKTLKSRSQHEQQLQNEVFQIIVPLRRTKKSLRKENIQNLDVNAIKREMTEIEGNIKNVKGLSLTALNQLKREEEKYNEELESFQDKLERWENRPTYSASKPQFKRLAVTTQANICKEAQEFMDFVSATGGHENGWSADDHALFLKVKNKTKDPRRVAEIIHMLLPDISEEAVVAHEKWYANYLDLKEKQKEAIKHWRTNKMSNKQISSAIERAAPDQCATRKSFSASGEKGEVEQKLVSWKKEKLLKTEYEKEQKRQEFEKQKELDELKKQKQEELRLQVQNWRLSKNKAERDELYKKQEEEIKEQKERALKANKLIKQFQCQDEIFIQNKLQMMQPQKKLLTVLKKRESYPRDPLRLLKPTQQWIMRTHAEKKDGESCTKHVNLQEIQKLGLPEWRKCIY